MGPELPFKLNSASTVNVNEEIFLILGGRHESSAVRLDSVLKFNGSDMFIEKEPTLVEGAIAPISILVPYNFGAMCSK